MYYFLEKSTKHEAFYLWIWLGTFTAFSPMEFRSCVENNDGRFEWKNKQWQFFKFKKRGRKATGKALTAAQRKAKQRENQDKLVFEAYVDSTLWTKALCIHALTSDLFTEARVGKKYRNAAYEALEAFL